MGWTHRNVGPVCIIHIIAVALYYSKYTKSVSKYAKSDQESSYSEKFAYLCSS